MGEKFLGKKCSVWVKSIWTKKSIGGSEDKKYIGEESLGEKSRGERYMVEQFVGEKYAFWWRVFG